jgi:hypothetical protein
MDGIFLYKEMCIFTAMPCHAMPCHALSVAKGQYKFSIDCEDLPTYEKTIGIWLYNSKIPEAMVDELQNLLLKWANSYDVKCLIYKSKNEYLTNK